MGIQQLNRSINPLIESQWVVGVERIKHFETTIISIYGIFLIISGYIFHDVLPPNRQPKPTETDYFFSLGFLLIVSIAHLHTIGRLINISYATIQIEKLTEGTIFLISSSVAKTKLIYKLGFFIVTSAPIFFSLFILFRYMYLITSIVGYFFTVSFIIIFIITFFSFVLDIMITLNKTVKTAKSVNLSVNNKSNLIQKI